jgi:histidinol-phosphate aminotransferase
MAVRAIRNSLSTLNRYPDGSGYYLKEKLSAVFGMSNDQIIIGNGSNEIIELIVRTFLSRNEEVIQASPTFLLYEKMVAGAGAKMMSIPLTEFKPDLDAIRKAITSQTKVIFINNPNNPTGSVLFKDELEDFLESIPSDVIVVLDEAYIEFVTDERAANGLGLLKTYPSIIVLRTFSKLYGLAGLRIGYGFASAQIIDYMNRVRQPFNVHTLAQVGATAALDDTEFVGKTLRTIKDGLAYLFDALKRIGVDYLPTQTNFFLIHIPMGGKKLYERMLQEGVIVRAMDSYGLNDYIRINVGVPEENERFIRTLKKVLKSGS